MSLNNVDSSNGYLECIGTDGYAVSEPQESQDDDFSSVQNIEGKFEFANISQATIADTLTTNELIQDGDTLVLIKNDDSVHELIASGVTGSGPYEMDTTVITGGEVPSKAYRVDEGVLFNNIIATGSGNTYSGTDPLLSTRTFDDVKITGTSCETKVQMSATGNKMTELNFDLWEEI